MGVYQRPDTKVWEFRKTIRGVKYYEAIPGAKDRLDAEMAEAAILRKIYEGKYGREGQEIGSTPFAQFAKEVYLPDIKQRLKQWKAEEYKVLMLCGYFKREQLKDITLLRIQRLRRDRLSGNSQFGRPRKASTVRGEISTLSSILEMAIDQELLGLNPCRKLKWGRNQATSERDRVLTHEEEARLMPQLEPYPETKYATIIALNTGLRRMGILLRKVDDVDRQKQLLRYVAKGGKTRVIPLNSEAMEAFNHLIEHATPDGYLFHVRTGHNLSANDGAFHAAVRRAGIKDLVFHDLRHTFSTRVGEYTNAFTVRDLLAHSDIKTTGIYMAETLDAMRRAVDSLSSKVIQFPAKTG